MAAAPQLLSPLPEHAARAGRFARAESTVAHAEDSASDITDALSVSSLSSIVSASDMVRVRVRSKRSGRIREYLVPRGTHVADVVDRYAADAGHRRRPRHRIHRPPPPPSAVSGWFSRVTAALGSREPLGSRG